MSKTKTGNYRWVICALLFFATTLNYLDRTVIGLLKDDIGAQFGWTESDYSNIVVCFQVAYAIGLLGAGWLIDKLGTKLGYFISVCVWSLATIMHGFAKGTFGFAAARSLLGLSEAGNFPAANKTVAEWFPLKERALATGIYNSGSNIGAIVAPVLIPWLLINYGWQAAFYATGALGLLWLVLWVICYGKPSEKKISPAELEYINSDNAAENAIADMMESEDVMVEQYIEGTEISIGCYKTREKSVVLPATEVVTQHEFFDYDAKYNGQVEEITPARLKPETTKRVAEITSQIYDILHCNGMIRIDYIISRGTGSDGQEVDKVNMIEINTTPGMTATSFIPQQVKAAGLNITDVLTDIVENQFR